MLNDAAAASEAAVRTWFQIVQPATYSVHWFALAEPAGTMDASASFLGTLNTIVTRKLPTRYSTLPANREMAFGSCQTRDVTTTQPSQTPAAPMNPPITPRFVMS